MCEEIGEEHFESAGSFAVVLGPGLPRTSSGRAVGFRHGCPHVKMPQSACLNTDTPFPPSTVLQSSHQEQRMEIWVLDSPECDPKDAKLFQSWGSVVLS